MVRVARQPQSAKPAKYTYFAKHKSPSAKTQQNTKFTAKHNHHKKTHTFTKESGKTLVYQTTAKRAISTRQKISTKCKITAMGLKHTKEEDSLLENSLMSQTHYSSHQSSQVLKETVSLIENTPESQKDQHHTSLSTEKERTTLNRKRHREDP